MTPYKMYMSVLLYNELYTVNNSISVQVFLHILSDKIYTQSSSVTGCKASKTLVASLPLALISSLSQPRSSS